MTARSRPTCSRPRLPGTKIAFRRIIAEHHEDMRRVCLAMAGDHQIADEAVQAAWLVAWKKITKVHGPPQLRPWLVSVAANEAKKLMSKRRRRAEVEVAADASGEPGGIDPATGVASVDTASCSVAPRPRRRGPARHALRGGLRLQRACRRDRHQPVRHPQPDRAPAEATPRGPQRWMTCPPSSAR